MGGKVWTTDEEKIFWLEIIPLSEKRLGVDVARNEPIPWEDLVHEMNRRIGNKARRVYTGLMLCEYFSSFLLRLSVLSFVQSPLFSHDPFRPSLWRFSLSFSMTPSFRHYPILSSSLSYPSLFFYPRPTLPALFR